jgi:hypothetical protein
MSTRLHELADHGQSVWIDFLSRDLLRSGELARLIREDNVSGVTSNPTIFAKALSGGDAYDEQIAASDGDARSVFLALAMRDVTDACDLLGPVWERTEAGDGYVSRSTPTSPPTPRPRSRRRPTSTRRSPARTCWSRSPPPTPACRRSRR